MNTELQGRTALVTGGSRGIGAAITRSLVAEGARVIAVSRSRSKEVEAAGAISLPADLMEPQAAEAVVNAALDELGGIDVLVNNVGGGDGGLVGGLKDLTDDQWTEVFDLNFFSTVRLTRAALPALLLASRGAIVNVSSIGARVPHSGPLPYTTAKAALTAFSKGLAEELGPRGVRVNTVSPGPVRTDMWEAPDGYGAELAASSGVAHSDLLAGLPALTGMLIGRLVEPAEVAALVTYLASPLSAATTGSDHLVDGGAVKSA